MTTYNKHQMVLNKLCHQLVNQPAVRVSINPFLQSIYGNKLFLLINTLLRTVVYFKKITIIKCIYVNVVQEKKKIIKIITKYLFQL